MRLSGMLCSLQHNLIFQGRTGIFFWSALIFLSIVTLQICGPAIVTQMIYFESEAIKVELHNQLMADRGRIDLYVGIFNNT